MRLEFYQILRCQNTPPVVRLINTRQKPVLATKKYEKSLTKINKTNETTKIKE